MPSDPFLIRETFQAVRSALTLDANIARTKLAKSLTPAGGETFRVEVADDPDSTITLTWKDGTKVTGPLAVSGLPGGDMTVEPAS